MAKDLQQLPSVRADQTAHAVEPQALGVDIAVALHPVEHDGVDADKSLRIAAGLDAGGENLRTELAEVLGAIHARRKVLPGRMQGGGVCSLQLALKPCELRKRCRLQGLPVRNLLALQGDCKGLVSAALAGPSQSLGVATAVYMQLRLFWCRVLRQILRQALQQWHVHAKHGTAVSWLLCCDGVSLMDRFHPLRPERWQLRLQPFKASCGEDVAKQKPLTYSLSNAAARIGARATFGLGHALVHAPGQ